MRRSDIDLTDRIIRVDRQLTEVTAQGLTFGPPKSVAGRRTVPLLSMVITDLAGHLDSHAQDGDDGLVLTSPEGAPLRHGNLTRRVWLPAIGKAGLAGLHFHDLRHAGNTYTANAIHWTNGVERRPAQGPVGHVECIRVPVAGEVAPLGLFLVGLHPDQGIDQMRHLPALRAVSFDDQQWAASRNAIDPSRQCPAHRGGR